MLQSFQSSEELLGSNQGTAASDTICHLYQSSFLQFLQAHNCNEAAECGLERKGTTTTAGCLQEDYYYRMSLLEKTITTGCILIMFQW